MNLLKALVTVSGMTLLSRILGFVRDFVVARAFGAGVETDAFFVAFKLPNLLRRMFAEGAFSQAFVPILAETRTQKGDEATHDLVNPVGTVLFGALLITCVLGVVGAPVLVWAMASGLPADGQEAAVVMTRLMFPYIGCMSLVALSAGVLHVQAIGPLVRVEVEHQGEVFEVELTRERHNQLALAAGETVWLRPRNLRVFQGEQMVSSQTFDLGAGI